MTLARSKTRFTKNLITTLYKIRDNLVLWSDSAIEIISKVCPMIDPARLLKIINNIGIYF